MGNMGVEHTIGNIDEVEDKIPEISVLNINNDVQE
jgi:hypothetical protein